MGQVCGCGCCGWAQIMKVLSINPVVSGPLSSEPLHVAAGGGAPQHSALATDSSSEQGRPTQIQCPFHITWILKIQGLGRLVTAQSWRGFVGKSCILCSGRTRLHVVSLCACPAPCMFTLRPVCNMYRVISDESVLMLQPPSR